MNNNTKIFLAGHKGLVGSAILRKLKATGYKNVLNIDRKNLDLLNQAEVFKFLEINKPSAVIIAAAKVGGIQANKQNSAEFIYENLAIQNNLIHGSYMAGIKNLIFLGSSCIYPRNSKQPIKEEYLLSGSLEKTNEAYAVAKIAGVKICEYYNRQYKLNYKSLMPCNTFGPNDNYNLFSSHFFPALISKIMQAVKNNKKYICLLGNGKTQRELIYVDDVADAIVFFLFKKTKSFLINIGTGREMTIEQYAKLIMDLIKKKLNIKYTKKHLTGTPRKVLDCSLAKKYGWIAKCNLNDSILATIRDYKKYYL